MKTLFGIIMLASIVALSAFGQSTSCPSASTTLGVDGLNINGNPVFAVDNVSYNQYAGPSEPGTLLICKRLFFNDTGALPQSGKNAFVSINHLTGSTTVLTNQDRALWVSAANPVGDQANHYSITGAQIETSVNGSPTFYCPPAPAPCAPDREVSSLSVQMSDVHKGNLPSPNFGINAMRIQMFRQTPDSWGSTPDSITWATIRSYATNMVDPGVGEPFKGTMAAGHFKFSSATATPPNMYGIGVMISPPSGGSSGKFKYNTSLYIYDSSVLTGPEDYAIYVYSRDGVTNQSWFGGPVVIRQYTPSTSSEACRAGRIWSDANYLYICATANKIKRIPLESF
jgi:hypothetical protein